MALRGTAVRPMKQNFNITHTQQKKEINGLMVGLFCLPLKVICCVVVFDVPSSTLFFNILQPQKFD
jgi:hypothetical protein